MFDFELDSTQEHKIPKRYTIGSRNIQEQKILSEGAFGYIWLAIDSRSGQKFALKRIICNNNESLNVARHQLSVLRSLKQCENVVRFYGGETIKENNGNTTVVILMELCPNGTLFDQMQTKQSTGFSEGELVRIIHSVAKGISSINSAGYAHRDIKIENVLIGSDGNYKLCDFGSCSNKVLDFGVIPPSDYGHYQDELEKNTTPMYRPPEIVDPFTRYKIDTKVDVWMLGCVLFTLSYFIHPFIEANRMAIAQGSFKIPKNSKYSNKLNDLIRVMLTPNPKFRPSIDQIINITKSWNQIHQVPLNQQAKELKRKHAQIQQQLSILDKKTVQFEGDIPIEQLMKIKKKIQQKAVSSSFTKPKETTKVSYPIKSFEGSSANKQINRLQAQPVSSVTKPNTQLNFDFFGTSTSTKPTQTAGNYPTYGATLPQTKANTQKNQDINLLDLDLTFPNPSNTSSSTNPANKPTTQVDPFSNVFTTNSNMKTQKPQFSSTDFDFFGTTNSNRPKPQPQPPNNPNIFNFF